MLKRIVNSDGFRIWFWPTLGMYGYFGLMSLLFMPVEPGSKNEVIFTLASSPVLLGWMWGVVWRYQKVKGKRVGKRCLVLLKFLTVITLVGIVVMAADLLVGAF